MHTPDKTIQRKGKGQRRKKQCQKRLSKRPATHLQSSCLSEFLTYCVTAVVNVQSIARMALKTSHSDAQTQVRMCLGSRCRGNGTECRKGHTDRTFLWFHFHTKKEQHTDPPLIRMCGISHWSPTWAAVTCVSIEYTSSSLKQNDAYCVTALTLIHRDVMRKDGLRFLSFPFDVWQREQISWLVLPYPISSFLPFLTTLWRLKDTGWLTSYKVCKLGLQIISLTCLLNSHLLYTFLLYTFWPFLGQKYKDD